MAYMYLLFAVLLSCQVVLASELCAVDGDDAAADAVDFADDPRATVISEKCLRYARAHRIVPGSASKVDNFLQIRGLSVEISVIAGLFKLDTSLSDHSYQALALFRNDFFSLLRTENCDVIYELRKFEERAQSLFQKIGRWRENSLVSGEASILAGPILLQVDCDEDSEGRYFLSGQDFISIVNGVPYFSPLKMYHWLTSYKHPLTDTISLRVYGLIFIRSLRHDLSGFVHGVSNSLCGAYQFALDLFLGPTSGGRSSSYWERLPSELQEKIFSHIMINSKSDFFNIRILSKTFYNKRPLLAVSRIAHPSQLVMYLELFYGWPNSGLPNAIMERTGIFERLPDQVYLALLSRFHACRPRENFVLAQVRSFPFGFYDGRALALLHKIPSKRVIAGLLDDIHYTLSHKKELENNLEQEITVFVSNAVHICSSHRLDNCKGITPRLGTILFHFCSRFSCQNLQLFYEHLQFLASSDTEDTNFVEMIRIRIAGAL